MDRLDRYRVFTRVVETRSFTKAANGLGMPRSSVSTAIADLEAQIGARLLNRTTRTVAPTAEGEEFHQRCLALLAEAEDMEAMFRTARHGGAGRIRVDVPCRIGRRIIAPALPAFLAQWPAIRVELGMTDRALDLLEERVDLALRVGPVPHSGLPARRIGEIAALNVASPAYLARHGIPQSPADLDGHWQVAYAAPATGRIGDWTWQEDTQPRTRPVPWRVSANSTEGHVACALAGMGLIQIPAHDVAGHLASGALVEVMPAHRPAPQPLHLLFPGPACGGMHRLAAFADWIEDLLRQAIG